MVSAYACACRMDGVHVGGGMRVGWSGMPFKEIICSKRAIGCGKISALSSGQTIRGELFKNFLDCSIKGCLHVGQTKK